MRIIEIRFLLTFFLSKHPKTNIFQEKSKKLSKIFGSYRIIFYICTLKYVYTSFEEVVFINHHISPQPPLYLYFQHNLRFSHEKH